LFTKSTKEQKAQKSAANKAQEMSGEQSSRNQRPTKLKLLF